MFVPKSMISEKWRPESKQKQLNFSYIQIDGLSKAFMYGAYVKSRSIAQNESIAEMIKQELGKYPYNNKRKFVVRDLSFHKLVD